MWNIKKKDLEKNDETRHFENDMVGSPPKPEHSRDFCDEKDVSFTFATTKTPVGSFPNLPAFPWGTDTNHPWRWLKPFISSKKMEAGDASQS